MRNNQNGQTGGHSQSGFTLVELMITVAILAVLVALAVPAYTDFSVRSKVSECVNGAAIAKVQISEYRQSLGAWPPDAEGAALNGSSGDSFYCDGFLDYDPASGGFSIDVDEATVNPLIVGDIEPRLTPFEQASGNIDWDCSVGGTGINNLRYLPSTCRDS